MTQNPLQSARSARLRYVTDERSGITRRMGRLGFEYQHRGRRLRNAATLKRIAKLAIPPAWTDVWICPDTRGHVQATGRDARGRKQYRYHADWRATRDETKYGRMLEFAAELPTIRTRTAKDLAQSGMTRDKVLATVVELLQRSAIRIGNEEYVRANGSFGLTTLKDKHVDVRGSTLRFEFRGKSGKRHSVRVDDRRLARIVKQCRDLPGQELFQYMDGDQRRKVDSGDVNEYLQEMTGKEFTAKDFRTWSGTVLACAAFRQLCSQHPSRASGKAGGSASTNHSTSKAAAHKNVLTAIDAVAGVLGNTRAVCRKSYIHPAVIDSYVDGTLQSICQRYWASRPRGPCELNPDETAVVALLRRTGKPTSAISSRRRGKDETRKKAA